jgi:hypothetical protein
VPTPPRSARAQSLRVLRLDTILGLLSSSSSLSLLLRLSLPAALLLLRRRLLSLAVGLSVNSLLLPLLAAGTLLRWGGVRSLGLDAALHGLLDLLGGVLHALLVALDGGGAVLAGGFVPVDLSEWISVWLKWKGCRGRDFATHCVGLGRVEVGTDDAVFLDLAEERLSV